jgi:hypothetical protein
LETFRALDNLAHRKNYILQKQCDVMRVKKIILLIVFVAVMTSLFFFSSWSNAMVVNGEEISAGAGTLNKISPLFAGLLIVIVIGILASVVLTNN